MKGAHLIAGSLIVAGTTPALAQSGGISPPELTAPAPARPIPQPPVGHRQPRATALPPQNQNASENSQDTMTREDAVLERRMKGICRGC